MSVTSGSGSLAAMAMFEDRYKVDMEVRIIVDDRRVYVCQNANDFPDHGADC